MGQEEDLDSPIDMPTDMHADMPVDMPVEGDMPEDMACEPVACADPLGAPACEGREPELEAFELAS